MLVHNHGAIYYAPRNTWDSGNPNIGDTVSTENNVSLLAGISPLTLSSPSTTSPLYPSSDPLPSYSHVRFEDAPLYSPDANQPNVWWIHSPTAESSGSHHKLHSKFIQPTIWLLQPRYPSLSFFSSPSPLLIFFSSSLSPALSPSILILCRGKLHWKHQSVDVGEGTLLRSRLSGTISYQYFSKKIERRITK